MTDHLSSLFFFISSSSHLIYHLFSFSQFFSLRVDFYHSIYYHAPEKAVFDKMWTRSSSHMRAQVRSISKSTACAVPASKTSSKPVFRTTTNKLATTSKPAGTLAMKSASNIKPATKLTSSASNEPNVATGSRNLDSSPAKTAVFSTDVAALKGLNDSPVPSGGESTNWAESFYGLGMAPFPQEVADVLLAPIDNEDIEIKPDGMLYLPEIKYRRILNRSFGPGGWGLAPRTESLITTKLITREYGLICHGRLVSVARGEQDYFGGEDRIPTALEGCKSNALMRCCKDLGIASELWDPSFIRKWKAKYADEVVGEHVTTKKKKKLWKLKTTKSLDYPYKIV